MEQKIRDKYLSTRLNNLPNNSRQLLDVIKNLTPKEQTRLNLVLVYFYNMLVEKIYTSKYQDSLCLLGGFVVGALFDFAERSSNDIDIALNYNQIRELLNEYELDDVEIAKQIMNELIDMLNQQDKIKFKLRYKEPLEKSINNVLTFKIDVQFNMMQNTLKVDLGELYPNAILTKRNHKIFLQDKYVDILTYPIEYILADKINSIFIKPEINYRTKDYYDMYLFFTYKLDEINWKTLLKAIDESFDKKIINNTKMNMYLEEVDKVYEFKKNKVKFLKDSLNQIKNNQFFYDSFNNYQNEYEFNVDINFDDVINVLEFFVNEFQKQYNKQQGIIR